MTVKTLLLSPPSFRRNETAVLCRKSVQKAELYSTLQTIFFKLKEHSSVSHSSSNAAVVSSVHHIKTDRFQHTVVIQKAQKKGSL